MSDINNLKVGFARVNITPMMGINISGYFQVRLADGVLDDTEINAIAVNSFNDTVLMLSIDICGITANILKEFRERTSAKTGIPEDAIYISSTHTHTGPMMWPIKNKIYGDGKLEKEYREF